MSEYTYVNVTGFTPNDGGWTSLADVTAIAQDGNQFTFTMSSGPAPLLTFLTPTPLHRGISCSSTPRK